MATKKGQGVDGAAAEILKDILILQLGIAKVPQLKIQEIVGCRTERVNNIVKHLKPRKGARAGGNDGHSA